jgi:hypothetical protein
MGWPVKSSIPSQGLFYFKVAEPLLMSASFAPTTTGSPSSDARIRGAGEKTLRDASSRTTKAFYPALSLCDMIFSGVFGPHPRLALAIVEFELFAGNFPWNQQKKAHV